jgi:8-oxo-dGTP diphosphatase
MDLPITEVAVCIVASPDGKVLVAQRTARQLSAGFWELPGGKIEPGETAAQAASRELLEETGLTALGLERWISYTHRFATRVLHLHFFRARGWEGTPHGREGQRLAWVDPAAPNVSPMLPSNDRALFALSLPATYVVADVGAGDQPRDVLARLDGALSQGARLIRVRISGWAPGQMTALLARVSVMASAYPSARILAGSLMHAQSVGLAGVHSCTRHLRRLTARPAVPVWAATCHDESDVARAVALGADFIVLSPVLADPERPELTPHGWQGLRRVIAACPVGVYAHGGLGPAEGPAVRQAGAAGLVVTLSAPAHTARFNGHTKDARPIRELSA